MLVLTRKKSETIQIGDEVTIKVIRTGATTVKIGIEAPGNVRILRGELCEHPQAVATGDILGWKPNEAERMEMARPCSDQFPHTHIA